MGNESSSQNCEFCKILAAKYKILKINEENTCAVIQDMDLNTAVDHILVVPLKHI
jgi:diadenosine tetraphosphate (Ap4A) HIT family hydrolase